MTSKEINHKMVASTSNNKHKLLCGILIRRNMKKLTAKKFFDVIFARLLCFLENLQEVAGFPVVDAAADL